MTSVKFSTTSDIVFGAGSLSEIGVLAKHSGIRHALLVTDGGIAARQMHAPAIASLEAAGVAVSVYAEVVADPRPRSCSKRPPSLGRRAAMA